MINQELENQIKNIYLDIDDFNMMPQHNRCIMVDNCKIEYYVHGEVEECEQYSDYSEQIECYVDDSKVWVEIISITDDKGEEFDDFDAEELGEIIKSKIVWEA